ncbi:MAG TPA: hypothetical protein VFY94_05710 [Rhodanobacteraceae bacterium]|jgi:hypothetical protein|nr:hypothetical protein [Rhodanobacteraceae bacterium]
MNRASPHVYPVDPSPEGDPMRSFDDEHGGHWQAALLEASFGNVLLIFSRIGGDGALRKRLDADNYQEAEQWLAGSDEASLRALLAEAEPWG